MLDNATSLARFTERRKANMVKLWLTFFTKAVQFDKWGQVVEAVDIYQELEGVLTTRLDDNAQAMEAQNYRSAQRGDSGSTFTADEVYGLRKIVDSIKLRVATLEQIDFDGPTGDEMAMVRDCLVDIVRCGPEAVFPFELEKFQCSEEVDRIARFESMTPIKREIQVLEDRFSEEKDNDGDRSANASPAHSSPGDNKRSLYDVHNTEGSKISINSRLSNSEGDGEHFLRYSINQTPLDELKNEKSRRSTIYSATAISNGGRLKRPKNPSASKSFLSISISRIGLKDAGTYLEPYMIVTVADARASVVEQQYTPVATNQDGKYVYFGDVTIHLDTPYEHIQEGNCSIFFEFMHYKQAKNKSSCRCWGLMEKDEIVERESISLELYKKPVDYRKKRIHLHSIKPLYLYVQAEVRRSDLDHNGFAEGRDGGKIRKKKYVKF